MIENHGGSYVIGFLNFNHLLLDGVLDLSRDAITPMMVFVSPRSYKVINISL